MARVDYAPGNETLYCLHTDHLATPRLATDSARRVVWRHEGSDDGFKELPIALSTARVVMRPLSR